MSATFLLVPQVKLPKRPDLARDVARAHDAVPGSIVASWVEAWFQENVDSGASLTITRSRQG